MKKIFYLAAIACMTLFASCEKEGVTHTGDFSGDLYGVWALTTKSTVAQQSDGTTTTKDVDYTSRHFYLVFSEFPFPHAVAKKGSLSAFDLDDVDVDAVRFSYNSNDKLLNFEKTIWLSDGLLTYNMILSGKFEVKELSASRLIIQQTAGDVTTVYTYQRRDEKGNKARE